MFSRSMNVTRIGNEWVFSNGKRLPVVSGGDETAGDESGGVVVTEKPKADAKPEPASEDGAKFTAADLERARQEEKDKLYKELERKTERLSELEKNMQAFQADEQERKRQQEEAQRAADEERQRREEEELSAKELIDKRDREWAERLEQTNTEWSQRFEELNEKARAQEEILKRERQFQALQAYKDQKLAEVSDQIAPELLVYIGGNNESEIDASISQALDTSRAIMESIAQANAASRGPRGVPATGAGPADGPLENQTSQRQLSAADIANMNMDEYAQYRSELLSQAKF